MLKVFEAFAGIGSQNKALKNIGIDYEIVGISEIDRNSIISYASIHTNFLNLRNDFIKEQTTLIKEKLIENLEKINVPLDYKTFENQAKKLKIEQLFDLSLANKLVKNYGDITRINPIDLPDFDFFTYSFPCQDISIAGYQKGLSRESGTRSSLLWESVKIIEAKKPKYLMMENVKNLISKRHKKDFLSFLDFLESLGYQNYWKVIDSKKYGFPQSRERVFCISILGNQKFEFPVEKPLEIKLKDLLETNVSPKFYLNNNQMLEEPIEQDYSYCLDANYWKGVTLKSFIEKSRRQLITDKKTKEGMYHPRRLTPLETWRLMGFDDNDFKKASSLVSNTHLYKQSGNSIVVPVLEQIFENLFI